jgi:hypothetical protein
LHAQLRNGKKLKLIKLVDGLLKYKQSWVYVFQRKLRLLYLKEKHIASHKEKKSPHWLYYEKLLAEDERKNCQVFENLCNVPTQLSFLSKAS